jgi:hypothetical protein
VVTTTVVFKWSWLLSKPSSYTVKLKIIIKICQCEDNGTWKQDNGTWKQNNLLKHVYQTYFRQPFQNPTLGVLKADGETF